MIEFKKYKFADICVFAFLCIVSELIGTLVFGPFQKAGFYITLSLLVVAIVMIRWGALYGFIYSLAGIPLVFLSPLSEDVIVKILYYPIANLFVMLIFLYFKFVNRHKIGKSNIGITIYVLIIYILNSIGRAFALMFADMRYFVALKEVLVKDAFILVITIIFLLIISKFSKGLLVDVKSYLIEIQNTEGDDYEE